MRPWLVTIYQRSLGALGLSVPRRPPQRAMSTSTAKSVFVVLGATGVGKSTAAIQLAQRIDGEVINVDAMQMYQGLEVATAKVTVEETQGIRHHLLSFLSPSETYTVKDFRDSALPLIEEIQARGKQVVLVGGTLYYIQALLWPSLIDEIPEASARTGNGAAKVEDEGDYSYERLCKVDPEMAEKLHPNDFRKIRRSIEIFEETGERNSVLIQRQKGMQSSQELRLQCLLFWLGTCYALRCEL